MQPSIYDKLLPYNVNSEEELLKFSINLEKPKNVLKIKELNLGLSLEKRFEFIKFYFEKILGILNFKDSTDLLMEYFSVIFTLSKPKHVKALAQDSKFRIQCSGLDEVILRCIDKRVYYLNLVFKMIIYLRPLLSLDKVVYCLELNYEKMITLLTLLDSTEFHKFKTLSSETQSDLKQRNIIMNRVNLAYDVFSSVSRVKQVDLNFVFYFSEILKYFDTTSTVTKLISQKIVPKVVQIIFQHLQIAINQSNGVYTSFKITQNIGDIDLWNRSCFILVRHGDFSIIRNILFILEPFFHPSLCKHNMILFVHSLCSAIGEESPAITPDILDLGYFMKKLLLKSMFGKDDKIVKLSHECLRLLGWMGVDLEDAYELCLNTLLDSVNQPHRLSSVLGLLSCILEIYILKNKNFKTEYLIDVMEASVTAIDMNDPSKSFKCLTLFTRILMNIPFDFPTVLDNLLDRIILLIENIEESGNNVNHSTQNLNDGTTNEMISRLHKTPHHSGEGPEKFLLDFSEFLFSVVSFQADSTNYVKIIRWIEGRTFTKKETSDCIAGIVSGISAAHPKFVYLESSVLKTTIFRINEEISQGAGCMISNFNTVKSLDFTIVHDLRILRGLVANIGLISDDPRFPGLIEQIKQTLFNVLEKCKARIVYRLCSKVFKELVGNLSDIWCIDYKSFDGVDPSENWGKTPREAYEFGSGKSFFDQASTYMDEETKNKSGSLLDRKEYNGLVVKWHIPSELEKKVILDFYKTFIIYGLDKAESISVDDEDLMKYVSLILNGLIGMNILIPPDAEKEGMSSRKRSNSALLDSVDDDDDVDDEEYSSEEEEEEEGDHGFNLFPSRIKVQAYYTFTSNDGEEYGFFLQLRDRIASFANSLILKMKSSDSIELYKLALKIIRVFINGRGIEKPRYEEQVKGLKSMKKGFIRGYNRLQKKCNYPRWIMIRRISLQHAKRIRNNTTIISDLSADADSLFEHLFNLSICRFAEIRIIAQMVLSYSVRVCTKKKYDILDKIFETLNICLEGEIDDSKKVTIKGCLYLLQLRCFMSICLKHGNAISENRTATDSRKLKEFRPGHDKGEFRYKFLTVLVKLLSKVDKKSIVDLVKEIVVIYSTKYVYPYGEKGGEYKTQFDSQRILLEITSYYSSLKNPNFNVTLLVLSFFELLLPHVSNTIDQKLIVFVFTCLSNDFPLVKKMALQAMLRILWKLRKLDENLESKYKYVASVENGYEFHEQDYIDRPIGNLMVIPKEVTLYRRSFGNIERSIDTKLKELFLDVGFWKNFLEKSSYDSMDNFSMLYLRFFKRFFQYFVNFDIFKYIVPIFDEEWFKTNTSEAKHRVKIFCEFVCGLLLARKRWITDDSVNEKFFGWLSPLFLKLILNSTPETLIYFSHCVNIGFQDRDFQRFTPIVYGIVKDLDLKDVNESGTMEAKKVMFKKSLCFVFKDRFEKELLEEMFDQVKGTLRSDFKATRDTAASFIWESMFVYVVESKNGVAPLSHSMQGKLNAVEFYNRLDSGEEGLEYGIYLSNTSLKFRHQDKLVKILKEFNESVRDLKSKEISNLNNRSSLNYCKSMIRLILEGFASVKCQLILPFVFNETALMDLMYLHYIQGEDTDLKESLNPLLTILPDVPIPVEQVCKCIDVLIEVMKIVFEEKSKEDYVTSRKTKSKLLQLVQVFCFRNVFYFKEEQVSRIFEIVVEKALLSSDVVEVKQSAGKMISGLIQCFHRGDEGMITKLRERITQKRESEDAEEIYSRVLGLSSLILAFPHEIKSWMPETLVMLVQVKQKNQMISDTIKKCFSEFRRTHQETWKEEVLQGDGFIELYGYDVFDRERKMNKKGYFTKEQLEILEGYLTDGVFYYA